MDDPLITVESALNAAAVWFLLKVVEVAIFMVYDVGAAFFRRGHSRNAPDADKTYDRRRGLLEFVYSGGGFLNLDLCREGKKWLLFISTLIPLVVFVLELMSIILGQDTSRCTPSKDSNLVRAPSLVLFGEGERNAKLSEIFSNTARPQSIIRPCVTWTSSHTGVEYLSSICVDTGVLDHGALVQELGLTDGKIRALIPKKPASSYVFIVLVQSLHEERSPQIDSIFAGGDQTVSPKLTTTTIGTQRYISEVVVNGRSVLYQNASLGRVITEKARNQILEDVRTIEDLIEHEPGEYFETEEGFGFIWTDLVSYAAGSFALAFAILAQSTREAIKTAARMSDLNISEDPVVSFDISCQEDFKLPKTASIVIIVLGVIFRVQQIFIPKPLSSVEYALKVSKAAAQPQNDIATPPVHTRSERGRSINESNSEV